MNWELFWRAVQCNNRKEGSFLRNFFVCEGGWANGWAKEKVEGRKEGKPWNMMKLVSTLLCTPAALLKKWWILSTEPRRHRWLKKMMKKKFFLTPRSDSKPSQQLHSKLKKAHKNEKIYSITSPSWSTRLISSTWRRKKVFLTTRRRSFFYVLIPLDRGRRILLVTWRYRNRWKKFVRSLPWRYQDSQCTRMISLMKYFRQLNTKPADSLFFVCSSLFFPFSHLYLENSWDLFSMRMWAHVWWENFFLKFCSFFRFVFHQIFHWKKDRKKRNFSREFVSLMMRFMMRTNFPLPSDLILSSPRASWLHIVLTTKITINQGEFVNMVYVGKYLRSKAVAWFKFVWFSFWSQFRY